MTHKPELTHKTDMSEDTDKTVDKIELPPQFDADAQFSAAMEIIQPSAESLRIRRARRQFTALALSLCGLMLWLVLGYVAPDMRRPDLSARPAPSAPQVPDALVARAPVTRQAQSFAIQSGDTLAALLDRAGADAIAADAAIDAARPLWNARYLKPGQTIDVYFETPPGGDVFDAPEKRRTDAVFAGFKILPSPRRKVVVHRLDDTEFAAFEQDRPLKDRYFLADTLITNSLYEAARGAGVPPNLVVDLIRLFSYTTDFQRDIREGDQLEVLYTRRFDENNSVAEEGRIYFAALTNRGTRQHYYALTHDDGTLGFYDDNGQSVRRLLMKTPIDGARLSSGYGYRRHPRLGYTRMHQGLDFAAPTGTRIFAAGRGTITYIGRKGSYGKFIKIKHRHGFETAYAHLSRYARGLRVGSNVRQGQVIGYVGSTGLSTGPHLHYEVIRNKRHVNPSRVSPPPGKILNAIGKQKLATARTQADAQISKLVARGGTPEPATEFRTVSN